MGDLVPFLPVYMKQLGLSSTETGIIYGVMPFISFLVRPLIGAVADKTRKHKLSLIICILFTGVCHCLLLFVPSQTCDLQNRRHTPNQLELCMSEESVHIICNEHELFHQVNYTTCQSVLDIILSQQDGGQGCVYLCDAPPDVLHELCTNLSQQQTNLKGWNLCFYHNKQCDILFFNTSVQNLSVTLDQYHEFANIARSSLNTNYSVYIDLDQPVNLNASICQYLCKWELSTTTECLTPGDFKTTFWLTFLIFLFSNIFYSPVLSLLDAIAYDILRERRSDWGKQRMWGTVGAGMFAVASSFAMESFSESGSGVNYTISFYIFFALTIASCIIAYFLRISESIRCSRMLTNIAMLLKYPKIVTFLCLVMCLGIMNAVIQIFLFWYLQERGSTQITLGLCVLANCLPEMGAFFCSGFIINRIGHVKCLYLATLGYAARFFGYSFLTNPWYVLFIEPLHCLTYGLMYSAATSYASIIAPDGMSATIQGLIGGLYMGFGEYFFHSIRSYLAVLRFSSISLKNIAGLLF